MGVVVRIAVAIVSRGDVIAAPADTCALLTPAQASSALGGMVGAGGKKPVEESQAKEKAVAQAIVPKL